MSGRWGEADSSFVNLGALAASLLLAAALAVAGAANAGGPGCGSGTSGSPGYAYAGHQASTAGHGVRARITLLGEPNVRAGHIAGWVGVGGPGSAPGGKDQWLQVGIAGLPQTPPMLYAEIVRPGHERVFLPLETDLKPGATRTVAVLETAGAPGRWRVWVGEKPVTPAIELAAQSRFRPIATAESWNGGRVGCNGFRFRFEHVGIASAPGGSWSAFRPGYDFLDRGYRLRALTPPSGRGARLLSATAPLPYAFEASTATAG
jgi:hypothetical protein